MIRRSIFGVAATVAMICAVSPALAQSEAVQASRLFRQAGASADAFVMVAGPAPETTPQAPVDAWAWLFLPAPRTAAGKTFDTLAMLRRVDCQAGTLQTLRAEHFLELEYRGVEASDAPPAVPPSGSLGALFLRAVCEPGYEPAATTITRLRTARTAADIHFSRNGD